MSGLSAPEITAAYNSVRSDKEAPNFLLLSYKSATSSELVLSQTGTGGLAEVASLLDDGQVQYAYVRVEYANDAESRQVKFALVIWIGPDVRVMRKARVGFESGEVKRVLSHHSIQVDAGERRDLDEEDVVKRLRRAGGADYNGGRG